MAATELVLESQCWLVLTWLFPPHPAAHIGAPVFMPCRGGVENVRGPGGHPKHLRTNPPSTCRHAHLWGFLGIWISFSKYLHFCRVYSVGTHATADPRSPHHLHEAREDPSPIGLNVI